MKTPDNANSVNMLVISLIIFVILFIYLINGTPSADMKWFIRVVMALAAGAMSMSLSGTINVGTRDKVETLAQKSPNVTAAGALAVFVLVYLFDPINGIG